MTDTTDNTSDGFTVRLIRLADGTLIDPLTRAPVQQSLQPEKRAKEVEAEPEDEDTDEVSDAISLRPLSRRSVADLTLDRNQMAVVNNVLVYTLWGLPDHDIAYQCQCTVHQVGIIRDLEDYKRMHDALVAGLRAAYSSTVDGIFAEAAPKAARGMVKMMKNKSADISISAKKDILDRAGHRPADRVEHMHHIADGELVIRVIKEEARAQIPTLDLSNNA